eukprot:CAMPEP_0182512416 /NCGR_PEP_ID=MMETSP1321-20130603/32126_1 /TAXON_ID=91990 /ORGANISM="Bolidomonas sp., Strain RCC1657" /LENGTH=343 /DNA_ID=CAMNT_0024719231 /DNA_START=100 /DNA_END=1127 /DNA_ORIENTATION=-
MGACSSTIGPEMTPEEVKKRRSETVKFRQTYLERAKKITPPPNCLLCVEVEPWIAAPEGVRGVDDALATFQRGSHTSTKEINMALSGMVSVDNKYDYKKSVVLSLKDKSSKDVITAAVMCEHNITNDVKVLELIWFVTQRKMEDKKYGSVLFRCIRDLAKQAGAKAILITSTPQATGFWLKHVNTLKDSEKFTTPVIRGKKLDKKMDEVPKNLSERRKLHFKELTRVNPVVRQPGADVRIFYGTQGGGFSGKPFRYNINSCSHIWLKVLSHNSKPLLSSGSTQSQSSSKPMRSNPSSLRGERKSREGIAKQATGGRAERRSREMKSKERSSGGSPNRKKKSKV